MRVKVTLACTECKQRNYDTMKNKKTNPDRLEMDKYCRFCKKHTPQLPVDTAKSTVTWLGKKELTQKAGVVAGIVTIFTLLVWVVDTGLGGLAALFLNK